MEGLHVSLRLNLERLQAVAPPPPADGTKKKGLRASNSCAATSAFPRPRAISTGRRCGCCSHRVVVEMWAVGSMTPGGNNQDTARLSVTR